jgi:hypothetical protein
VLTSFSTWMRAGQVKVNWNWPGKTTMQVKCVVSTCMQGNGYSFKIRFR